MNKNQNIEIVAGDTPVIQTTIEIADGSAFDPTGATAIYTVAKAATSTGADVLFQKSTAGGSPGAVFTQDQTSQQWSVNAQLAEADTSGLAPGAYYHETLIIESGGKRSHAMTGKFTVLATPNA